MSLALALAALAAPAGAATGGEADQASAADKQSLRIWAYFDGDTPVTGGEVHVYADGRRLRERGDGPGPVRTFPGGMALLRFTSLPSALRIVVSGGHAGGERVRGSLKAKVRGVTDGELVHVNPVTTVTDVLGGHADDGLGLRHARNLTERTLGIRRILGDQDLYSTDRWFEGDRFLRWTLEQGSVEDGARHLAQLIERPGFDRRPFLWDGARPDAGAAASGGASARNLLNGLAAAPSARGTARDVINGLADAVAGAAGLTGPAGFAVSGAALVFKTIINLVLEDPGDKGGEDPVSAQLRAISAQIAQLQTHIDGKFLALQIQPTRTLVSRIYATQQDFLDMLKWARVKDDPAETEQVREQARTDFKVALRDFLRATTLLKDEQAAATLDNDLLDKQVGTVPNPNGGTNTVTGPALIPAVRQQVGSEHFFTSKSSNEIRGFFQYYAWAEAQLATVLTEYYMLGGDCGLTKPLNECDPARGVAATQIERIETNITNQRAALPPKILDPSVFIDRNTHNVWTTKVHARWSPEILGGGLRFVDTGSGCAVREFSGHCTRQWSLVDNTRAFPDLDQALGIPQGPWGFPTAADYQGLFGGPNPPGEPTILGLLKSLGVNYQAGPQPPAALAGPAYFWLRDDFYSDDPSDKPEFLEAALYDVPNGATKPKVKFVRLGERSCGMSRPQIYLPPIVYPHCERNNSVGAYILYYRGLNAAQGGAYWCEPHKDPSWNPKDC
jgi:hypothetical protein